MFRINPRRMWVWMVWGGVIGAFAGALKSDMDAYTGLLLGIVFGWSARSLLGPWMWRPQLPRQQYPRLDSRQGQRGDDDPRQDHAQANEGDGKAGRDLEGPGGQGPAPGPGKR